MKNTVFALLMVVVVLAISSCDNKSAKEDVLGENSEMSVEAFDVCGTWNVSNIEYEGALFSVEEWNAIEYEDYSEYFIVFKDGGQAYVYEYGYGDLVNWLQSGDKIIVDGELCEIEEDRIIIDDYDARIHLMKTSDSQTIPKTEEDEDDYDDYNYDEQDELTDEELYGTWLLEYIIQDGETFEECKDLAAIVFAENNEALLVLIEDPSDREICEWYNWGDEVDVGDDETLIYENDLLIFGEADTTMAFYKASDNQDFSQFDEKENKSEKASNELSTVDWKEFLKEYEEWVDSYISLANKVKNNPSDLSYLTEYTEMMTEMAEWAEKADEVNVQLSGTDAMEYAAELARIIGKLSKISL